MRARAVAVASEGHVAEVASAMLARGNAIDSVISGVFAAAAFTPTVLLGPVQLLIGGAGAGLRAIDGRGRQPGFGVPRPRGFKPDEAIPPASRVAIPTLPAALAIALASFGRTTLAQVMAPALDLARPVAERARLLKRLAQHGPAALAEDAIGAEIVAVAGRVAGGLVTLEDMQRARPAAEACEVRVVGDRRVATVPWGASAVRGEPDAAPPASRHTHVIAAADGHGLLALACYEAPEEGLAIPELGVMAPFFAAPVLRGQERVKPGDPRPTSAPIALIERDGALEVALGIALTDSAEPSLWALLQALGTGMPAELALAKAPPKGRSIGVVRDRDGVQALSGRAGPG